MMGTATDPETVIDRGQFNRLAEMVYNHCGITLHDGKQELVRARVSRQLRSRNFATASAYLESVMADPGGEEFASLIDALSTNLTSFFREGEHFRYLSNTFIPALLDRKRRAGSVQLRAWSAACSTGEEPYTLAITLLEALQGKGKWDAKILATDISRNVLRTAKAGVYDADRVRSVPEALRKRYFQEAGGRAGAAEVSPELRNVVRFNYLNLMEAWPFSGPFDFIFCRNVMIYFDKPTQEKLVGRFHSCLAPGGLLFTGHSESLTGISHRFQYVQPTIYQRGGAHP